MSITRLGDTSNSIRTTSTTRVSTNSVAASLSNTKRTKRNGNEALPVASIARLGALTTALLLAPGLLMSFTLVPVSPAEKVTTNNANRQHFAVSAGFTPISRTTPAEPVVTMPELAVTATPSAPNVVEPAQPPKANEFTRHLSVVSLHQATNAELQLMTNTTAAFSGRFDQAQLVVAQETDSSTREFQGVGYPHIQTTAPKKARRFRSLITYADLETRSLPIPNVRCMGLSPRAVAKRAKRYSKSVEKLSARYSIDANLVRAVMTRESCFNNDARSYVGAMGLMQLMPETAAWLKVEDPTDAQQNLRAGIRYLASLRKRFGTDELALAAYNAGPGNVERHNGIPPFKETQYYVKSVMSHYRSYVATEQFTNSVALN